MNITAFYTICNGFARFLPHTGDAGMMRTSIQFDVIFCLEITQKLRLPPGLDVIVYARPIFFYQIQKYFFCLQRVFFEWAGQKMLALVFDLCFDPTRPLL